MSTAPVPNWRQLAEAASKENNLTKLLQIVGELCKALDKAPVKKNQDLPVQEAA